MAKTPADIVNLTTYTGALKGATVGLKHGSIHDIVTFPSNRSSTAVPLLIAAVEALDSLTGYIIKSVTTPIISNITPGVPDDAKGTTNLSFNLVTYDRVNNTGSDLGAISYSRLSIPDFSVNTVAIPDAAQLDIDWKIFLKSGFLRNNDSELNSWSDI